MNIDVEKDALIGVSDMVEHEDGSATFKIDTTPEATRLLVEIGLVSLLEKAIDENNKEYSLDPSMRKDEENVDEKETKDYGIKTIEHPTPVVRDDRSLIELGTDRDKD